MSVIKFERKVQLSEEDIKYLNAALTVLSSFAFQ